MEKLNKNEIIELVAEKALISKRDAKEAIEWAFEEIKNALLIGKEVNISNFGSFVPIKRKARVGTDPKLHHRIEIKAKNSISFRPSKVLKESL